MFPATRSTLLFAPLHLFARSGLRIGKAARYNLTAVLDNFPIPATVSVIFIGHNAEFNTVSHGELG